MEKQMAYHVLGIEETKEEEVIKNAYRSLLKRTNPEDDPEGFRRLREAYDEALRLARLQEKRKKRKKADKSGIERWVDRVDEVYQDLAARCEEESWEEVFSDPLCEGIDTSQQLRDAFLTYLMEHIYLPLKIWKRIDRQFQIVEDQEQLLWKFPKEFVEYMVYYIEHEPFLDFGQFRAVEGRKADWDEYIRNYLDIKYQIDQGQTEGQLKRLDDLAAFGVYHPYADVERLRLLSAGGQSWREDPKGEQGNVRMSAQLTEAQALADRLLEECGEDANVLLYCGEARWAAGRRKEAYHIWRKILEKNPDHYTAQYAAARYLIGEKEYEEGKELLMDLLSIDGGDPAVLEDMRKTNEVLIARYRESIAGSGGDEEKANEETVQLGWCLFQNEKMDEALELMKDFTPVEKTVYSYENLYGRILYKTGRYAEALPHLERWLEMIHKTPKDEDKENIRRRSREFRACHLLGSCCYELGKVQEAFDYVDMSVEAAELFADKQICTMYKAHLLFEEARYRESIELCDRLLREDEEYFPAILQRQEASYRLKDGQQVVDDYYRAIQLYTEYYKPYLLAAEAFFDNSQFSDAQIVMDRARENHVEFSPGMRLCEIKILRNLAEEQGEREKALKLAKELLSLINENPSLKNMDIEDRSEVEYEIALLQWESNNHSRALKHLKEAIAQNPKRTQYRMIRGHIYLEKQEYKKALEEYFAAQDEYEDTPVLHYHMGLCLEGLGMRGLAMDAYENALACQEAYEDANEKLADFYKDRYLSAYDKADFKKAMGYLDDQLDYLENSYYRVEKGRLYMAAYGLEEAVREFEKALFFDSEDWAAHNNMGCCYKYMGRFEKAIECLEKAARYMGEGTSVLPYSNMADCYEAMGDYRKAIWCYEKDLEMFPDRREFYQEIGLLYQYLGDYDKAVHYFQMDPGLDDYYDNMACAYFLQGKEKEAVKTYVTGIRRAGKEAKTNRMCDLAYFYMEILGEHQKAEEYYKKAIAAAVTEDDLHETEWKLAALYFRVGRKKDARFHAGKAMEHFYKAAKGTEGNYLGYLPCRPARLMRFGWIYICLGETQKGLNMFRQMTRCRRCRQCRHPGCFESYQYLGMYYEAIGNRKKAYEYYKKAYEWNTHGIAVSIAWKRIQT